jgi:hypothetical protein
MVVAPIHTEQGNLKYSELNRVFDEQRQAWAEFAVLLVEPDVVAGDDIDVQISPLRMMKIDHDARQIVVSSGAGHGDDVQNAFPSTFEMFMNGWPLPEFLNGDYDVVIALPLAEEDVGIKPNQVVPLAGVRAGLNTEEAWLLVRPVSEYPAETLPD